MFMQILPMIEQGNLFNAYNTVADSAAYSYTNTTVMATPIATFTCPSYAGPMLQQGQADWNGFAGTIGAEMKLWWIAGTCYKGNLGDNTTGPFPGSANGFGDLSNGQPTINFRPLECADSVSSTSSTRLADFTDAFDCELLSFMANIVGSPLRACQDCLQVGRRRCDAVIGA